MQPPLLSWRTRKMKRYFEESRFSAFSLTINPVTRENVSVFSDSGYIWFYLRIDRGAADRESHLLLQLRFMIRYDHSTSKGWRHIQFHWVNDTILNVGVIEVDLGDPCGLFGLVCSFVCRVTDVHSCRYTPWTTKKKTQRPSSFGKTSSGNSISR